MPKFPCVCGKEYPNTFQMNRCMRSAECKPLEEEKDVSSANRPAYAFDFESAKACSIDKYQWDKFGISGAHHSMGGLGSLGVFLLDLKNGGGVIVMKQGSIQSAAELYCSLLYRELDISAPSMRVLHSGEYGQIITQLGECAFTSPGAGDHLQSRSGMSGVSGQRGALLMEFSPGVTFKHPSVKAMLEDAGKSKSLLTQFGNLIAVDMLVNNFDRSPAIWTHEGNANNILIELVGDEVVVHGIDQGCTPIVNEQYGDDRTGVYTAKVTEMIQECADGNTDGPKTAKISDFLNTWCGVDIGATGRKHIQDGIVETCIKIAMYEGFQQQQSRAQSLFTDANWGTPGLTSINVGFLEAVAEAIANAVSQIKESASTVSASAPSSSADGADASLSQGDGGDANVTTAAAGGGGSTATVVPAVELSRKEAKAKAKDDAKRAKDAAKAQKAAEKLQKQEAKKAAKEAQK